MDLFTPEELAQMEADAKRDRAEVDRIEMYWRNRKQGRRTSDLSESPLFGGPRQRGLLDHSTVK